MKRNRQASSLPLRPDPFFFRLQWGIRAEWAGRALEAISARASTIQLEAVEPLNSAFLSLLQKLDNRPEKFRLRLVVNSSQLSAPIIKELIEPLSRLKKLVAFLVIINSRADEKESQGLYDSLIAAASAGLRPGLLLELEPETTETELRYLVIQARRSGALEIALRPWRPADSYIETAGVMETGLANLKAAGIPVSLEECFPGIRMNLERLEINCRRASGSCFMNQHDQVKACRQSGIILGDLKKQELEEILFRFLNLPEVCPRSEARAQFADVETEEGGRVRDSFPVQLDASLRPLPLFSLRKRDWGAVLLKGTDGLVLSPKGERLVRMIDGRNSLGTITKKFGVRAAGFIYGLFIKGFVRLEK